MKVALTLDDLPQWHEYPYPKGHSARSVADALVGGFSRHGIQGVYAFANSKPFEVDALLRNVLDDWCAAGHCIANHTHSHPILHQTTADHYIADLDIANALLAPWIVKAPGRYFRYTWNIRGETQEKFEAVCQHLEALEYQPADCSSWFFEWDWDLAYIGCLERNDANGIRFLKQAFVEFAKEQLLYDDAGMRRVFGRSVPHILLLHNVSFIELVLNDFLASLHELGVEFISLDEAMADEAYGEPAKFPCGEFLIYWRKLLWRDGIESAEIPGSQMANYNRVLNMVSPHH